MDEDLFAFRRVPYMGVIYVVAEAAKLGYHGEHADWCNLGQGMPEVGPLPGAPGRVSRVDIAPNDHAYGPVNGLPELRAAVAQLYNSTFRSTAESWYAPENVAIVAGGRLALSRAIAALGPGNVGYFTPDYTAYEDMLSNFDLATPVHIELRADQGFSIPLDTLEARVREHHLRSLLISNPCNPTGVTLRGEELAGWVGLARGRGVTLLLDEFYSHYAWGDEAPVSAARWVEDVNTDPVVLFDGLTKNYRYPGWRVGWVLGPRSVIENLSCAGSFLDGGGPRWVQRAALEIVEPSQAAQETGAMRSAFRTKRDLLVGRLKGMGLTFAREPEGTFYGFASVAGLRPPLNDGFAFFREALQRKVITVPGVFFDVNPGKRRTGPSPLAPYVRFSFGAPYGVVERGLDRLEEMIRG